MLEAVPHALGNKVRRVRDRIALALHICQTSDDRVTKVYTGTIDDRCATNHARCVTSHARPDYTDKAVGCPLIDQWVIDMLPTMLPKMTLTDMLDALFLTNG